MEEKIEECCSNCRFYHKDNEKQATNATGDVYLYSKCRRYPPVDSGGHPQVYPGMWCGEWQK
jgi:hypothetical protein